MTLRYGSKNQGWYRFSITGDELSYGENGYNIIFSDSDLNSVSISDTGPFVYEQTELTPTLTPTSSFSEITPTYTPTITPTSSSEITLTYTPTVTASPTYTPTVTISPTYTPILTSTPTATITPTLTPQHQEYFYITSPEVFYYNSLILTWTKVSGVHHYRFHYLLHGLKYIIDLENNYLAISVENKNDWNLFSKLGTIVYWISAHDEFDNEISVPTEKASFTCLWEFENNETSNLPKAPAGCLELTSPQEFHYNTILLSWTPIEGALNYNFKYKYNDWMFEAKIENNFLRVISPNMQTWDILKNIDKIYYSITALDADGNAIDGPTSWEWFECK